MEVNWELTDYTVPEGTSISVCAVVEESTEIEFVVGITALASQGKENHRILFDKSV